MRAALIVYFSRLFKSQLRELLLQQLGDLQLTGGSEEPVFDSNDDYGAGDSDNDSDNDMEYISDQQHDANAEDFEDFDDVYYWPKNGSEDMVTRLDDDGDNVDHPDTIIDVQETNTPTDNLQKENAEDELRGMGPIESVVVEPKKKRKNKKKKKNLPFVEDVVEEGPDEEHIYDTSTSADSRFRLAMDRFRKNRIFTPVSSQILPTYFSHGGMDEHVDVVPRYSSVAASAAGPVELDVQVDIVYNVRTFLSTVVLTRVGWYDVKFIELAPKIVAAFLRYLLAKRVVPEYDDQVKEALEIAMLAQTQTIQCHEFNMRMPHVFNISCSILFTEFYALDELPDEAFDILYHVAQLSSAQDATLTSVRFLYAKVLEQDLPPRTDAQSGTQQTIPDGTQSHHEEKSSLPNYVKVQLKECTLNGDDVENPSPLWLEPHLYIESDIAALLQPGMMIRGKFWLLSTGHMFARPVLAFPAFYLEEDEDGPQSIKP
ncbi:hypothetical protein BGZ94_008675 [Podila epigama]|nr:hypothetical protein BGZ94_008675 [Podila epigama]